MLTSLPPQHCASHLNDCVDPITGHRYTKGITKKQSPISKLTLNYHKHAKQQYDKNNQWMTILD